MSSNLQSYLKDEIQKLKDDSKYLGLKDLQTPAQARVRMEGQDIIQLSSNNYLGLTTHPYVVEKTIEAVKKWGVGAGAVRPITGTMSIHLEFERKLAEYKGTEATLLFQSGYTANVGVVAAIMQAGDIIISDELNHASIIDGCRLCKADRGIFKHKDYDDLRRVLTEAKEKDYNKMLVVTDSVFSMDGDVANMPKIADLCEEFGATPMVDDAHASGVFGKFGSGTVDHFDLKDRWEVQIGTLSKAFGVVGGYVAGSQELIDFLIHKSRPFLFSSGHPPAVVASCMAAMEVLQREPELIEKLWENTKFFKAGLNELGFNTGQSESPITPVIVGSSANAVQFSKKLWANGVFAKEIIFPMVPDHLSRVRTIVMATHTKDDLQRALDVFAKAGRELNIIQ